MKLLSTKLEQQKAFTLAEVLITLGIIGVVAALTLPTLIANYQNKVYVNKLKKLISTLENGIKKAAADEGVEISETRFFELFNTYSCLGSGTCDERFEIISKYFNVIGKNEDTRSKSTLAGNSKNMYGTIIFADGSAINYDNNFVVSIDINGDNKPNVYGRDYFEIRVDGNGLIHDTDDCDFQTSYNTLEATNCGLCKEKLENNPNFEGCYLYRIQSDGWQMKY